MEIRTRFAPSPTGFLHIGGARTALFSWAYARRHQGKFLLRIEDTDRERSTQASIQAILDSMQWLALEHDEAIVYQTQRYERYREIAQQLLQQGHAYVCNCSPLRLEQLRNRQLLDKQKPRYDGHCRDMNLSQNEKDSVIRFRTPTHGKVIFDDEVHGHIEFDNHELDDLILVRSDGNPTYNFCVVIDDWDMRITHVIRGDDHINNTPRQINIFKALQATPPVYAHLPMILGADGKRLSKRHGAVSVMQYRDQGYLPDALLNYLVRLGWSHGNQEIFSRHEMIEFFDLSHINKAAASINPEKLDWLNQHYMKQCAAESLQTELKWHFSEIGVQLNNAHHLLEIFNLQRDRCKTLREIALKSRYFYEDVQEYNQAAIDKHLTAKIITVLKLLNEQLPSVQAWQKENIHQWLTTFVNEQNIKFGELAQPLRIALTGDSISPPIDITLELLGKEIVSQRLAALLEKVGGK